MSLSNLMYTGLTHLLLIISNSIPVNITFRNARSLEAEDYIVIESYDGYEAIEKSKAEMPELISLDFMLPGMKGI